MILRRVLQYVTQRGTATPAEIAHALESSPDAVRGMLGTLQQRGLVHRVRVHSACGTQCRQCGQAEVELYAPGAPPRKVMDDALAGCPSGADKR